MPIIDGKKQGKGEQNFEKDGEEYTLECTWVDGKKSGEGILLDSGSIIAMKLFFNDDVVEGEGTLYSNGQVIFKGMWKNGYRCGHCTEYVKGYKVYDGNYENDVRNGYGIEYGENNEIKFEGEWVDGKPGHKFISENKNGVKELTEEDDNGKVKFIGGYKEGSMIRNGLGVEYDEDGKPTNESVYEDGIVIRKVKEFKDKVIVLYDVNGKKCYEGGYKNNREAGYPAEGKGKQYIDGVIVYNGDFVKGQRDGYGCSYYANHVLKYEGDWKNDKANGNGKFNNEEGLLIAEGEFTDDLYDDGIVRCNVATGKYEKVGKRGCFC